MRFSSESNLVIIGAAFFFALGDCATVSDPSRLRLCGLGGERRIG